MKTEDLINTTKKMNEDIGALVLEHLEPATQYGGAYLHAVELLKTAIEFENEISMLFALVYSVKLEAMIIGGGYEKLFNTSDKLVRDYVDSGVFDSKYSLAYLKEIDYYGDLIEYPINDLNTDDTVSHQLIRSIHQQLIAKLSVVIHLNDVSNDEANDETND